MLVISLAVLMVTPCLVVRVSLAVAGLLVTPSLIIGMGLSLGLLVGDSSCVCGESASTASGASASDHISSSSLESGSGMGRRLKVLTWGLPCRWLKVVSLYVMGNLGFSLYEAVDAAEHVLSRELGSLSDSIDELYCKVGLPATTFPGVTGGVSVDGGAGGNLSSSRVTLALGRELVVDRCQRRSSMDGAALVLGAWEV